MARELAPAGQRSGPKRERSLRNRAGASSLATGFVWYDPGDQPLGLWRKLTASRFQLLMVLIASVRSTSSSSLKLARARA